MKITSLRIIDPRRQGRYLNPYLDIGVDEPVDEMGPPRRSTKDNEAWQTIPCGPFVAVEKFLGTDWTEFENPNMWTDLLDAVDIGRFNTLGLHHEQLTPVRVWSPGEGHLDLFMGVRRTQRAIRKFIGRGFSSWSLIVDERLAMDGKIVWRLKANEPSCFASQCIREAKQEVYHRGTYIDFCVIHLREHNNSIRDLREAANH